MLERTLGEARQAQADLSSTDARSGNEAEKVAHAGYIAGKIATLLDYVELSGRARQNFLESLQSDIAEAVQTIQHSDNRADVIAAHLELVKALLAYDHVTGTGARFPADSGKALIGLLTTHINRLTNRIAALGAELRNPAMTDQARTRADNLNASLQHDLQNLEAVRRRLRAHETRSAITPLPSAPDAPSDPVSTALALESMRTTRDQAHRAFNEALDAGAPYEVITRLAGEWFEAQTSYLSALQLARPETANFAQGTIDLARRYVRQGFESSDRTANLDKLLKAYAELCGQIGADRRPTNGREGAAKLMKVVSEIIAFAEGLPAGERAAYVRDVADAKKSRNCLPAGWQQSSSSNK